MSTTTLTQYTKAKIATMKRVKKVQSVSKVNDKVCDEAQTLTNKFAEIYQAYMKSSTQLNQTKEYEKYNDKMRLVTWTYGKRTFFRYFSSEGLCNFITELLTSPVLAEKRQERIQEMIKNPVKCLDSDPVVYDQMKEWFPYLKHVDSK